MKISFIRKTLCICMVIAMSLSLAACGSSERQTVSHNKKDSKVETVKPAEEITEEPVEEPVEEPAEEPETEPETEPDKVERVTDLTKYEAHTEVLTIQNDEVSYPELEIIPINYAYATSQLDAQGDNYDKYAADNVCDGDVTTAYVEGVDGDGRGEMLEMDFDNFCSYEVSLIRIYPGYQKDEKTFKNNSRPTELFICFPDGHFFSQTFDYGDSYAGYFDIDLSKIFTGSVVAHECTIMINDAIMGDKYDDCCISEIEFYSPKTPSQDVVLIKHETEYGDNGETCRITATSNGAQIWEYEGKTEVVTELDGVGYITTANGIVFVQNDWQVVALDERTGDVLWKSSEENGFSVSATTYDVKTGNLYICGYYGPTLIGFDKDGNTITRDKWTSESYWPCMLIPADEDFKQVKVYFESDSIIEFFEV